VGVVHGVWHFFHLINLIGIIYGDYKYKIPGSIIDTVYYAFAFGALSGSANCRMSHNKIKLINKGLPNIDQVWNY
jgi:hypothetical protein